MEPIVKTYEECIGVYLYLVELYRSSNRRCFKKKVALKNLAKFTGKHLCQSLCFPVNFATFLRIYFLKNICERLPLVVESTTTQKLNNRDLLLVITLTFLSLVFSPSFIYDFFIDICFGFEETNYMEKLYGELHPILKYKFKEQNLIFRLRQQIWSCGICRLKSSTSQVILKTIKRNYNIRNKKSDLAYTISERFSQVITN